MHRQGRRGADRAASASAANCCPRLASTSSRSPEVHEPAGRLGSRQYALAIRLAYAPQSDRALVDETDEEIQVGTAWFWPTGEGCRGDTATRFSAGGASVALRRPGRAVWSYLLGARTRNNGPRHGPGRRPARGSRARTTRTKGVMAMLWLVLLAPSRRSPWSSECRGCSAGPSPPVRRTGKVSSTVTSVSDPSAMADGQQMAGDLPAQAHDEGHGRIAAAVRPRRPHPRPRPTAGARPSLPGGRQLWCRRVMPGPHEGLHGDRTCLLRTRAGSSTGDHPRAGS